MNRQKVLRQAVASRRRATPLNARHRDLINPNMEPAPDPKELAELEELCKRWKEAGKKKGAQ